jgi:thymidylate kinase
MERNEKPFLIALEGPAGTGKTTLQRFLCQELASRGMNAAAIPEFSCSPVGQLLKQHSEYGRPKPDWIVGVGGLLSFLADKVSSFEATTEARQTIWISDRLMSSQFVLGLKEIKTEWERQLARKIISQTMEWASRKFFEGSVLILLEAPAEVLVQRLEKRLGVALTQKQRTLLEDEVQEYRSLNLSLQNWHEARMNSGLAIENVADRIISLIPPQWAN